MSKNTIARPKVTSWPSLEELIIRDHGVCWLCKGVKGEVTIDNASRDHVIPKSRRGSNKAWNLRLAHAECNRLRADRMASRRAVERVRQFRLELIAAQRRIRDEWKQSQAALVTGVEVPEDFFAIAAYSMWAEAPHQGVVGEASSGEEE